MRPQLVSIQGKVFSAKHELSMKKELNY